MFSDKGSLLFSKFKFSIKLNLRGLSFSQGGLFHKCRQFSIKEKCVLYVFQIFMKDEQCFCQMLSSIQQNIETLPKALRTQALTALVSTFGLVGLVQYAWQAMFDLCWQVWLGRFCFVGLAWFGRFGKFGLVNLVW